MARSSETRRAGREHTWKEEERKDPRSRCVGGERGGDLKGSQDTQGLRETGTHRDRVRSAEDREGGVPGPTNGQRRNRETLGPSLLSH